MRLLRLKVSAVTRKLGHQECRYDDTVCGEKWLAAMATMFQLRFSQDDHMQAKLPATVGKCLYEAPPCIAISGIRVSVKRVAELFLKNNAFQRSGHVGIAKRREIFGQNLLDKAFMKTRT